MTHDSAPAAADGSWLFELATRLSRLENVVLQDVEPPLTFRQYRMLRRVTEGQVTITAMRQAATLSLAALSESVDGVVRKGLLERRVDESDRRASLLRLTPAGERALADAQRRLDALAEDLLGALDPDRRAELHESASTISGQVAERLRNSGRE